MFTLHNGDCLQVLPSIPSGSIDAIITDLPYGTTACAWDEVIPFVPMWEQVKRVLKQNGVFVTTASQPFTSVLIVSNLSWFKYEWIWNKGFSGNFVLANTAPMKRHENIVVFSGGTHTYNPQMTKKDKPIDKRKWMNDGSGSEHYKADVKARQRILTHSFPQSIIEGFSAVAGEANNTNKVHPTQKPLDLYRYLIRTYTNEGEMILDFCMGSGTTIEAAEIEGRNSIGIEKEIGYFQIAEKRAKSAVLQQRLFTPSNNRLHMDAGDSPRQPSQSTLEGFTPAEQGTTPAPRQ